MSFHCTHLPACENADNHLKIVSEDVMNQSQTNRFQEFFADDKYITLKNYLYNYQLRKYAVEMAMRHEKQNMILEVGSGVSPVAVSDGNIVYSDVSLLALQTLKQNLREGMYVVADGMNLPFRSESFSHVISSEVLEHLEDDAKALSEIAGVIKPSGVLVITFPHRRFYFSYDDRFVKHFRRYELSEMESLLQKAQLFPILVRKVLGPLEKITMCIAAFLFSTIQRFHRGDRESTQPARKLVIITDLFKWCNKLYAVFAWLDAKIMPRSLSTVLLIKAVKK
jgi:ubiquinone/menaquinone biosynthesis C-methylase UbiE